MPRLLRLVCPAALVLALGLAAAQAQSDPDPRYWRLDDINVQLAAWQAQYPAIVHLDTLGLSGQGEAIPMARISDNAAVKEPDEPVIVFHAAQHANECNGTGAIMKQMQTLLEGYGTDPVITARVDGLEIWFIPVFNVDGHRYVFSGQTHWADWRKTLRDNNANGVVDFPDDGVDLDRNWDWYWNEYDDADPASQNYRGPYPWSESEVGALRDFVQHERPVLVIDYHSPVTITWTSEIFYPWVSTHGNGSAPDYDVARDIALDWAAQTRDENNQHYNAIFGYDTLPKEQNWLYGRTGTLTYIMEISDHCWWSGATVDTIATRVARGSTFLLDRTLQGPGIRGTVTDAATGLPLQADVEITQMESAAVGPRLTDPVFGQFYRLTLPGTYTVTASARDYTDQSLTVLVNDSGWATADFALQLPVTAVTEVVSDTRWLRPLGDGSLRLVLPAGRPDARVDLFDLRGRRLASLGRDLSAGAPHVLPLPDHLASGVYLVRARSGSDQQVVRVTLVH